MKKLLHSKQLLKEISEDVEQENLRYMLGIIENGMRMTGIWPMKNHLSNLKFTICTVIMTSLAIGCTFGMYNARNLEFFIESLLYFIVTFSTLLKLLIVKLNQKILKVVLKSIAVDCSRYFYLPVKSKKRVTNNVKNRKLITLTLIVFLYSSIVAYVFQTYDANSKNMKMIRALPFFAPIPRAIINSPMFYVILGFVLLAFFFVWAVIIVTIDSTFAIAMIHATNQFIILSEKLKVYNDDRFYNCIRKENQMQYCKCIKCIIKEHIATLRFMEDVESAFYVLLLVELTRNILHFGIQIHNLIWLYKVNSIIKLVHVTIILFSMNLHLLLYCGAAKSMTEAGEEIGVRAFKMKWYDFRAETIHSMMLLILRSQKPCYVTAAKFVNLSLETYTSIITTSLSYASVILATRGYS